MRLLKTQIVGFLILAPCLSPIAWGKSAPQTEIHVSLLGQPCLLQGPFDEATLRSIHSIGPAQLYAPNASGASSGFVELNKEAHKALEKLRSLTNLPSLLDRYREKLGKRLEAQIAFFDTVEKQPNPETFIKIAKKYVNANDLKAYEKLVNKSPVPVKRSPQFKEWAEALLDSYNDGIEPDPEEEFHRSIKKMSVQYVCSFDETEETNSGGEE